jgi:pyruvate formate lyase activating enzyme
MSQGRVFDIQQYAVHDGPGIRTLVFLKGCPLRCAWCCNPESQVSLPELRHVAARCQGCFSCIKACPQGAIVEHHSHLQIDRRLCQRCEVRPCIESCPQAALSLVGREMSVGEVLTRVAADIPFYRNSGGGVTFSGGEPLAQPAFLKALLQGAKSLAIHTAVSTCGLAPIELLFSLLPLVDLFLFDLKIKAPEQHRHWTGVDNRPIHAALRFLVESCPNKIMVRIPIVVGCTDSPENAEGLAILCHELGLLRIILEPYHALGTSKYEEIGRALPLEPLLPSVATLEAFAQPFQRWGIDCQLS